MILLILLRLSVIEIVVFSFKFRAIFGNFLQILLKMLIKLWQALVEWHQFFTFGLIICNRKSVLKVLKPISDSEIIYRYF
jgi:hypothetical protein